MAYMTNTNEEDFGDLTAGADITVSHFAVIANDGETGERVIMSSNLAVSRTYTAGDPLILPAGTLDINFPEGNVLDVTMKEMLDTFLANKSHGVTLRLGTADMTDTGMANEVPTSRGYSAQLTEIATGLGSAPS